MNRNGLDNVAAPKLDVTNNLFSEVLRDLGDTTQCNPGLSFHGVALYFA